MFSLKDYVKKNTFMLNVLFNKNRIVNENQMVLFPGNLFNYAKEVKGDQGIIIGCNLFNYAKEVKGDQGIIIGCNLFNYAGKAKIQLGGILNISKSPSTEQYGLINYNSHTGFSLFTGFANRLENAKEKFSKLERSFGDDIVKDLASRPYSLTHKLTKIYTTKDLVKREARKKLK